MSGHLVLIGLSGSGKSTVGRLLAVALACPLYDTDTLLAEQTGVAVPDLLRADPVAFRAYEEEAVAALVGATPGIISTGGGIVLSPRNRTLLRAGNLVIWLYAPLDELERRLSGGEERPLLSGHLSTRLAALLAERAALYAACAHLTLETGGQTPQEATATVLTHYRHWREHDHVH